ncbi:MAG: TetR/AcrR family transcriptional regulator [Microcella sp.]|uniref:TetR/AcrR family transcriptional regulator n=1 Tax=Microcella sp. TaxID=1913979 RepID=UPI00271C2C1E|nr:TetR/AcrR family transcriptional regulator [Microcella sp.]MDO8337388.1 TetR/AcrR family transcriptional regulator [Microcella sp.]
MPAPLTDVDRILTAAADILMADGYDAVTIPAIAAHSGLSEPEVSELFQSSGDALVAMLNREFAAMYAGIVDHIERDPRGGLLSRVYLYILAGIYERPLSKTLFVIDRDALNRIMRHSHSFRYVPQVGIRGEMIERLQEAGMVRRDIDASMISSVLSVCSAGLALTAPHDDLDLVIRGISDLLARSVDADVADTEAGKRVFYDWATSLTIPSRSGSDD